MKSTRTVATLFLVGLTFASQGFAFEDSDGAKNAELVDRYIDQRFEAEDDATEKLLKQLGSSDAAQMKKLEGLLRAPRASYPELSKLNGKISAHSVKCYHVDYESKFLLYVPKELKKGKQSLVIVGHGGNSSMSPQRAESTALAYLRIYAPGFKDSLVVAPVSSRGWGHIGNSLILSTISKVQRLFHVDPDRVYVTGQSMGGHMSYRAALTLSDRWGAVSPHSGGYDFVAKKSIANLASVPGYAIWGKREPYGINKDNRTNAEWGKENGLDWTFVEKNGGHTIYRDELPKVAKFFADHPRDLYRKRVRFRVGGTMKFTKTWNVKSWPKHTVLSNKRPLRWNIRHWVEVEPRADIKEPQTVVAENVGDNQLKINVTNVRQLSVYLHPRMVDMAKPVRIVVNDEVKFNDKVRPDPAMMLELVREFDDRGRVFWAKVELMLDAE